MKTIVKIKFGSHLYGTETPTSDIDIKGIYIPSAQEILLQRIQPVILNKKHKNHGEKNVTGDIDCELYSPERFLLSIAKGQSFALEMLFAPDSAILYPPHPSWHTIKALAPHILTKQAISFVNYCKQQAYKYCQKGYRLAAARLAFETLITAESQYGTSTPLYCILDILQEISKKNSNLSISSIRQLNGTEELYFQICGKKTLLNASIKNARLIAQKTVNEYGSRAIETEKNEGADWKALSHAVRIGNQAIEFFKYHYITLPRPEKKHLLAIKQGKILFEKVAEEIEGILTEVQNVAYKSTLPENYNQAIIDNFIEQFHLEQIRERSNI